MAGRAIEGVAKLCQRRLYSWLSSRCGLPVCIVGSLLLLISILQFGEVLLEWSKERYEYQFSIYADNIVGKSYERYLSTELPIDVVYTWVNGSDPILLEDLRELKRHLSSSSSSSSSSSPTVSNVNSTSSPTPSLLLTNDSTSCPFSLCVPFNTVLLDASSLPLLTLSSLSTLSPLLSNASSLAMINSPAAHLSPVHMIQLPSEEDVNKVLREEIKDESGNKILTTRGYLTNDSSVAGAMKMDRFLLVKGQEVTHSNSQQLRSLMKSRFHGNLSSVEVKGEGIAVVEFTTERGVSEMTRRLVSDGETVFIDHPLQFLQSYLIWIPFSLPTSSTESNVTEKVGDDISASRFEDNEEMRYSLRSVYHNAPWIRHIFIVTNGQIPSWLNLDHPRITLVTHQEIFPNKSHLPTFSSPAIETHLHRIPGLSKRFIYLNDDVMFGAPIWPEDFYTPQRGQKVYLSWPVPYCAEGCPPNWITDRYCDQACNNSMCDWDGGDCEGATRYGFRGPGHQVQGSYRAPSRENCNTGCLNNWLGDRYCDQACRVPDCGYDAGDCGTERWDTLYSVIPRRNHTHFIPTGITAMYFNLTSYYINGTISSAEHTHCPVIRTAVVAQTFKTISLTFSRNTSRCTAHVIVNGTTPTGGVVTVNFSLSVDTATVNETKQEKHITSWSFPDFNSTHSNEFLDAVSNKLRLYSNKSVNYQVLEHSKVVSTGAPATDIIDYVISNTSLLPVGVATSLAQLDKEKKEGDLTMRGYLKRRSQLLKEFPHLLQNNGTISFEKKVGYVGGAKRKLLSIDEKRKSLKDDLIKAVSEWEKQHGPWDPNYKGWESRRLPWEKLKIFPEEEEEEGEKEKEEENEYVIGPARRGRHLLDVYGDSLRFVNKLLTRAYGHDARKVPAHMSHMINREVMDQLQARYPEEFAATSSHKLRSSDDMQFSFSYFYFLMSEKKTLHISDAFTELDSDQSGILSVRELRTLLAMVSDLPLHLGTVHSFETMLRECDERYNGTRPSVDPVEYETHYDPNLPLVTVDFVKDCPPLLQKLNSTFHSKLKYKFEVVGEEQIAFKMINENATKVMEMLDEIRKEKKKFICLNDNIDHSKEGAHLAKLILLDFYESMFPFPSPFELPPQYRNRFLHVTHLNEWMQFRRHVQVALHVTCGVLLSLTLLSLFYGKIVQCKRKLMRRTLAFVYTDRTKTPSV